MSWTTRNCVFTSAALEKRTSYLTVKSSQYNYLLKNEGGVTSTESRDINMRGGVRLLLLGNKKTDMTEVLSKHIHLRDSHAIFFFFNELGEFCGILRRSESCII